MKKFIQKISSRKFLLTVGTVGYGVFLIRQGDVTQGVALITGAAGTYNIGQGMADAKVAGTVTDLAEVVTPIASQN